MVATVVWQSEHLHHSWDVENPAKKERNYARNLCRIAAINNFKYVCVCVCSLNLSLKREKNSPKIKNPMNFHNIYIYIYEQNSVSGQSYHN